VGSQSGGSSTANDASSSGEPDDGIKLDVGSADDGGPPPGCTEGDCGCTAVDVLFVIDNSGSMCFYQEGLAEAFPSFVDAMYEALPPGTDLHVGITTSGFELGGSHAETNCVAQEDAATLDAFYTRPGEGMVEGNGLQGRLLEWEGQRFATVDTGDAGSKDALSAWFSGAASSVGCSVSSFEFPAAGLSWALHPDNAATNDGFLRDEGAVLVMFALTDEADQSLEVESLDTLRDAVLQAKSGCGGEACIVTGGLLSSWCTPDQNASFTFLSSFGDDPVWGEIDGGGFGNVDVSAYEEVVGGAFAQVVAQTCEEITPEG
jgi:hypothetical protein